MASVSRRVGGSHPLRGSSSVYEWPSCENIENGLPTDLSLSHHDLQIPLGDRVVRGKNQSFSTSVPRIFFANCSGRRFTGNRPFQENEHFFVLNPIATLLLVASTGRQFYSTLEKKKRLPSWECTNVLLLDKFLFCGHHHPLEMSSKSSSPFELNRKQYKN